MKKNKFKINKKGSTLFILFAYIVFAITVLGFTYDLCRVMYYKTYLKNMSSTVALSTTNRCYYIDSSASLSAADRLSVIIMDEELKKTIINANGVISGNNSWGIDPEKLKEIVYDYYGQIENDSVVYPLTLLNKNSGIYFSNMMPGNRLTTTASEQGDNFNTVFAGNNYLQLLLKLQKAGGDVNTNMLLTDTKGKNVQNLFGNSYDFIVSLDESEMNRDLTISNEGMTQELINAYSLAYLSEDVNNLFGGIRNLNRYTHGKDGQNGEVEVYLKGYIKNFFFGQGMFSNMPAVTEIYTVATAQPQIYDPNLNLVGDNTSNSLYGGQTGVMAN